MAPQSNTSLCMLVMGACFALAVGADCGRDCALCVYRLLEQQTSITSLRCSIECEGTLDPIKLRSCRDVLLEEDLVTLDNAKQQEEAAEGGVKPEADHQLAKKYGGFMKRYGGFMSRRSPAAVVGGVATEEEGGTSQGGDADEEDIKMQILKILNAEAEGLGQRGGGGSEVVGDANKRYGGFMRRGGGDLGLGEGLEEGAAERGLKKRYGGFMRRVGRPEWLVDNPKSAGGVLKRAWEEGGDTILGEIQKRYGGFMD